MMKNAQARADQGPKASDQAPHNGNDGPVEGEEIRRGIAEGQGIKAPAQSREHPGDHEGNELVAGHMVAEVLGSFFVLPDRKKDFAQRGVSNSSQDQVTHHEKKEGEEIVHQRVVKRPLNKAQMERRKSRAQSVISTCEPCQIHGQEMKDGGEDRRDDHKIRFRQTHRNDSRDQRKSDSPAEAEEHGHEQTCFEVEDGKKDRIGPCPEKHAVSKAALIGESQADVISHGENAEDHDLHQQGPGAPRQHETKHHEGDQNPDQVNVYVSFFHP